MPGFLLAICYCRIDIPFQFLINYKACILYSPNHDALSELSGQSSAERKWIDEEEMNGG